MHKNQLHLLTIETHLRALFVRARLARSLFFYYSLYNGRGIFYSEDVCQVRMVARLIYISPTTGAGGKPKLMSVPTFRFNQRSPCRDAIEVGWKTVVSVELAGALKVLGHCKSRECSNLSRFQRD